MSVVNCKVKYIRQNGYDNLEEWMKDNNNIYIGRKGIVFINKQRFPSESSPFCNIYKIGIDGDRDEVIQKYKNYIVSKIKNEPSFKDQLLRLKNKNLGCWCSPDKCHGDVLLELIHEYS